MTKYYKGNFIKDAKNENAKHRGWLVGEFMKGARKTHKVEIKFWRFKKSEEIKHQTKFQRRAIECTFVLKGKIKAEIDDREIILKEGDYVVIPPKIVNNLAAEIIKDAEGFTVKAPSDRRDKVMKEGEDVRW